MKDKISIKNNKLYIGGVYTVDISEQANILETLCIKSPRLGDCISKYTKESCQINDYLRTGLDDVNEKIKEELMNKCKSVSEPMLDLFTKIPD